MTKAYASQAAACMKDWRPLYNEMYTLCLAVTGSQRYAREALAEAMIRQPEKPSRRKALADCREASLRYALESACDAADCLSSAPGVDTQSSQVRRCAFLHYGCQLTVGQIAKVLRVKRRSVRPMLKSALASLQAGNAEKRARTLKKLCAAELRLGADAPDEETFRYALEKRLRLKSEAEEVGTSGGGKRLFSWLAAVVTLAFICFAIWLGSLVLNYYHEKRMEDRQPESIHVEVQWDR